MLLMHVGEVCMMRFMEQMLYEKKNAYNEERAKKVIDYVREFFRQNSSN